jgi:DNA/RNA endonuclease G (NUC1)
MKELLEQENKKRIYKIEDWLLNMHKENNQQIYTITPILFKHKH